MSALLSLIKDGKKPVIGMVQLAALPGSSRYLRGRIDGVLSAALSEAEVLTANGIDALMVQNLGDLPVTHQVSRPQIAWMTRITAEIASRCNCPIGLNLLENDAEAMLAVASAVGADFIRVKVFIGAMMTPFGTETGQAFAALRARNAFDAANVAIFADVHDRTGNPIASGGFTEDVDFAVRLGGADGLVVTGKDYAQTLALVSAARKQAGAVPILVGGGVTVKNFAEVAALADGAIVSSSLKNSSTAFGQFDPARVKEFMQNAKRARPQQ